MSYALVAVFTLPKCMGEAEVAELIVARYNMYEACNDDYKAAQIETPRLALCLKGVLEFELNVQINVEYFRRAS